MSMVLEIDAMFPDEYVDSIGAISYGGIEFTRRGKCVLTVEHEGYPCNDYRCSACGKVHNAPRPGSYCPRCGCLVAEVVFP